MAALQRLLIPMLPQRLSLQKVVRVAGFAALLNGLGARPDELGGHVRVQLHRRLLVQFGARVRLVVELELHGRRLIYHRVVQIHRVQHIEHVDGAVDPPRDIVVQVFL